MAVPPSPPPPRTPPRFVPTLTEVVHVPGGTPAPQAPAVSTRTTVMPAGGLPPVMPPAPASKAAPLAGGSAAAATRTSLGSGAATGTGRAAVPVPGVPAQSREAEPVGRGAPSPSVSAAAAGRTAVPSAMARPMPDGMEEYVVHRIMQRVDVVLDQRLREAIATVVQEQTRSVLPRLREEIESVVRHAVYEAVADELASGASPAPTR